MTAVMDDDLVARIEAIVVATPGVTGVFRSGSTIGRALDTAARALGMRADDEALVSVTQDDAGVSADILIGVSAAFPAGETVRRVHDAIAAEFGHDGLESVSIRVTVVHIDEATVTASALLDATDEGESS